MKHLTKALMVIGLQICLMAQAADDDFSATPPEKIDNRVGFKHIPYPAFYSPTSNSLNNTLSHIHTDFTLKRQTLENLLDWHATPSDFNLFTRLNNNTIPDRQNDITLPSQIPPASTYINVNYIDHIDQK